MFDFLENLTILLLRDRNLQGVTSALRCVTVSQGHIEVCATVITTVPKGSSWDFGFCGLSLKCE